MKKKNRFGGFTLIELIISSLIVSCVAAAVYSVFSGGISAWKRSKDTKSYERSLRLVSEAMAREIRNTFKFSGMPFEGTGDSVSFAGLIENLYSEQAPVYEPGKISYFLGETGVFCRKQQTYPEVFQESGAGIIKELIPDVAELNFSYFGFDAEADRYEWSTIWPKILDKDENASGENQTAKSDGQDTADFGIPKAIRIELELSGEKFTKTIMIPLGDEIEKTE
jgi:prepilin-type N-terminal cleavage/methylation domain-containing protein